MVILLIISFIVFVLGAIKSEASYHNSEGWSFAAAIGAVGCIIAGFVVIATIYNWANLSTLPAKIEMYEQENVEIETEVSALVDNYMIYEGKTLTDLKVESPTALIALFPELKANELVGKQIDVYIANNNVIKKMKLELLSKTLYHKLLFIF